MGIELASTAWLALPSEKRESSLEPRPPSSTYGWAKPAGSKEGGGGRLTSAEAAGGEGSGGRPRCKDVWRGSGPHLGLMPNFGRVVA